MNSRLNYGRLYKKRNYNGNSQAYTTLDAQWTQRRICQIQKRCHLSWLRSKIIMISSPELKKWTRFDNSKIEITILYVRNNSPSNTPQGGIHVNTAPPFKIIVFSLLHHARTHLMLLLHHLRLCWTRSREPQTANGPRACLWGSTGLPADDWQYDRLFAW